MSDQEPAIQPDPSLRLTITPEPTDAEAAAIAAAISMVALASAEGSEENVPGHRLSPWAMSGRLAAHQAAPRERQRHWSRALAWLGRG